ncbi:MAG: dienelactone hydrolase family protein [Verrucomicrobia bacterium]|nr:dienelactone hydrolase family protein [Verrucomicrobiota bacterium]
MKSLCLALFVAAMLTQVQAALVTKTISYRQGETELRGYLAYDDSVTSDKKAPGVLVFPEWWGMSSFVKGRADALAKLGYVAFAADMYGDGQVTTDHNKAKELATAVAGKPVMGERAQAAYDQLIKTGLVDDSKVAAIGFCFGGACSQILAYSGAPLKGVVSFHGALIPASADAAKKNQAKFLILQGELDPLVPQAARTAFIKSMDEGKFDYQFLSYSGAVHAFMNPDADKARADGLDGVGYDPEVATRAWAQMQLFFKEIFG